MQTSMQNNNGVAIKRQRVFYFIIMVALREQREGSKGSREGDPWDDRHQTREFVILLINIAAFH